MEIYVAWNWKAGTEQVQLIQVVQYRPSTVSQNTTSGFSIVQYVGEWCS